MFLAPFSRSWTACALSSSTTSIGALETKFAEFESGPEEQGLTTKDGFRGLQLLRHL